MDLDPAFIAQCAPGVAPETIQAIVRVESRGDPLALGINGPAGRVLPDDPQQAVSLARRYIDAGYSVDLGLMQINSNHLEGLGLSVEQIFEPCTNLRAGALIVSRSYTAASAVYGEGQRALRAALSAYNTGHFEAGFRNGYVARYLTGPAAGASLTPSPTPEVSKGADTRIPLDTPEVERIETPPRGLAPDPTTADTRVPLHIDDRRKDDADTDQRNPAHPGHPAESR
jgi:type IV secretion system protein VirB1